MCIWQNHIQPFSKHQQHTNCIKIVKCYQVRSQSLKTTTLGTHARKKHAAVMVKTMHQNDLHDILPVLYKVASILATIPATLCSAERSFSALLHQDIF